MHIAMKTIKYRSATKYVILGAAAKVSLIVQYSYWFLLLCMLVYNVKQVLLFLLCYCQSGICFVTCKLLLLIIPLN